MKKFFAALAFAMASLPAIAADPPTTWTVTCLVGGGGGRDKVWTDAVGVRRSEGGFSFVSMKQGEILTSAGMNCWVQPNLPPRS
jgi:hypothetical protein